MTVQVDSQPVTDQNMWYFNTCFINNSISCLEKKQLKGTNDQTCYVHFNVCKKTTVCLSPLQCLPDPVLSEGTNGEFRGMMKT